MIKLRHSLCITLIVFSISVFANNELLDRRFWKSKPSIETIQAKIKEGNNPTELNKYGFDAIVYALLENTDNKIIQYLLSIEGNGVNKLTHDGRTYIFWAAYKGNTELMIYLLEKGAKTNLIDDHGYTILNFAASTGQQNTKVFDICIKHGANLEKDVDKNGANALLLTVPFDKTYSITAYFKNKGIDITSQDKYGNGIFNYAATNGNIDLLKKLYNEGLKGNDEAVMFASKGSRGITNGIEVFEYLASIDLNISTLSRKNGNNPLHNLITKTESSELINYLIKKGVSVNLANNEGNTPFMYACSSAKLNIIELLTKELKNINHTNKNGETALSFAVKNNSSDVVEFLLKKEADSKVIDKSGNNLMYYLIQSYSEQDQDAFNQKIDLLKKYNVDFNSTQNNQNTILHIAIEKNSTKLIEKVLNWTTEVNQKNKNGETPLHIAAMKAKDTSILELLIKNGADKNLATEFGETAYMLAKENEVLSKNNYNLSFLK